MGYVRSWVKHKVKYRDLIHSPTQIPKNNSEINYLLIKSLFTGNRVWQNTKQVCNS